MNTAHPNKPPTPGASKRSRRGVAVGILLVSLVVLVGLVALALNVVKLSYVHEQLRAGCESAALAAAVELLDEGILYGHPDLRDDVAAALAAARHFANKNMVAGRPLELAANPHNDPRGDLVVGWVQYPDRFPSRMQPWDGHGPANSVLVRSERSRHRGNAVALWFGQALGVLEGDVANSARATLDCRVFGFRPARGGRAPVVPLAADYDDWMDQAMAAAVAGTNDCFTVDYQDGTVRSGSDGIPEIELRYDSPSGFSEVGQEKNQRAAAALAVLVLAPWREDLDWQTLERQLLDGLGEADLRALGGQLALDASGSLLLAVLADPPRDLHYALNAMVGVNRAWPLGMPCNGENGEPAYQLVGFGAARVVGVEVDGSLPTPQIVVRLQPSLLVSSMALVRGGMNNNPWIGKLELTQ